MSEKQIAQLEIYNDEHIIVEDYHGMGCIHIDLDFMYLYSEDVEAALELLKQAKKMLDAAKHFKG